MTHLRRTLWCASFLVLAAGLTSCLAPSVSTPAPSPDGYLFCFWNVENLFDDRLDHSIKADKSYDDLFAKDPRVLQTKLDHLSQALLKMNDGKGPDILAIAEVESERAAELLRETLNRGLADEQLHYSQPLFREIHGGRHIATAVLTRLPVERDRTHLLDKTHRALEVHLTVAGHDLVVVASHWTSRVSDAEGAGRVKYANLIYGHYRAMFKNNPSVDFLVCGDFNDPPDADSVVKHLHAHGDLEAVVQGGSEPALFNLMAGKSAYEFGTHYYKGFLIFDQIAVSPGLLDSHGWTCDVDSVKTMNQETADRHGHPKAFGNEHFKGKLQDRGASDHFPVTVRLKVNKD